MLDRRVNKLFHFGEGDHLVKFLFDLDILHAEDRTVQKNVFATTQLRLKSCANLQ